MVRAARGSFILLVAFLAVAILKYVLNVVLGWLLAPEQYGTYGSCIAFLNILSIAITFSFPWALTKFLSSEQDSASQYRVFKSALLGNVATAIVIGGLFYIVYSLFLNNKGIDAYLIYLILAVLLISSARTIYLKALNGFFRFGEMGVAQVLEMVLMFLASIVLVHLGYGVVGAIMGMMIATFIILIVMVYMLRDFKFWQGKDSFDLRVFTFTAPMFFGMLGLNIVSEMDILGVKYISPALVSGDLTGYYQAVRLLANIPYFTIGAVMAAIFPFISKYAKADSSTYSLTSLKYAVLFVLPVVIAIATIPSSAITLFFPGVYAKGAEALAVLAIGMGILSIGYVLANTFQAIGKPGVPAVAFIAAVPVQIALLFILIPRLELVGAALATLIACFCSTVWLGVRYIRMYQLKIRARQVMYLVLAFGLTAVFIYFFPHQTRLLTIVVFVLAAILYLFLVIVFGLVNEGDLDILSSALPRNKIIEKVTYWLKRLLKLGFATR